MATESIIPLHDNVLLEEAKAEPYHIYKQFEHVIVPSAYEHGPEDRPVMGKVLSKGEACVNSRIHADAIAFCPKWTGARFQKNGTSYVIVREENIIGILE